MRHALVIFSATSLALLSACAGGTTRTDASPPTVTYSYEDDDDYDKVASKADDYCDDSYDLDAVLVDRDDEGSGYEATFACQ